MTGPTDHEAWRGQPTPPPSIGAPPSIHDARGRSPRQRDTTIAATLPMLRRHTTAWWACADRSPSLRRILSTPDETRTIHLVPLWPSYRAAAPNAASADLVLSRAMTTMAATQANAEPDAAETLARQFAHLSTAHGGPYRPDRLALVVPRIFAPSHRATLVDAMREAWNPHGAFTGMVDADAIPLRAGDPVAMRSLRGARGQVRTSSAAGETLPLVYVAAPLHHPHGPFAPSRVRRDERTGRCPTIRLDYVTSIHRLPTPGIESVMVTVPGCAWLRVLCLEAPHDTAA